MKKHRAMIIVFMATALCMGQKRDASDTIFNESKIYRYDISFYTDKWVDSLEFNKANDELYIPARFAWHKGDGDSVVFDSIGVRYKGNSSYTYAGASPKKPYKFYFNKYRKNQLFYDVEKLNFSNLVRDPSCMREKISYDLCRRLVPVSRAVYAVISVQGAQIGLYLQLEQVDECFLTRNFKDDQSNLYKSGDQGASLKYLGQNQSAYEAQFELKTNTGKNDWSGLILMLDKLNNTSDTNFVKVVGKCLDLDNCIRYLAFNMVTSNFDSYTGSSRNIYLYDDQQSKQFKLIPWDFNLGLGNYAGPFSNVLTVDAFNTPNLNIRPLCNRILSNDSLRQIYGKYIAAMINYSMCPDTFAAVAERIKPVIDSAVKNDPHSFYTYEQFLTNIDNNLTIKEGPTSYTVPGIKSFPTARYAQLKTQLEREKIPVLNPVLRGSVRGAALRCGAEGGGKRIIVKYSLRTGAADVAIEIHNVKGDLLYSGVYGTKAAGSYTDVVDARSLPSGFYAVSLRAGKTNGFAGMMLVKK